MKLSLYIPNINSIIKEVVQYIQPRCFETFQIMYTGKDNKIMCINFEHKFNTR